jgi:hypothetical protein
MHLQDTAQKPTVFRFRSLNPYRKAQKEPKKESTDRMEGKRKKESVVMIFCGRAISHEARRPKITHRRRKSKDFFGQGRLNQIIECLVRRT